MFKKIANMNPFKQSMFDIMIAFAVIAFWRGAWGLLDAYLFPNNPTLSSLVSLLLGVKVIIIVHYLTKKSK